MLTGQATSRRPIPACERGRCGASALLNGSVHREALDPLVELRLRRIVLFVEILGFLLQGLQAILLIVELPGVTLRERAVLGAALEGFQILTDALRVVVDGFRFVLTFRRFVLEPGDLGFLLDDLAESRFALGLDRVVLDEERKLVTQGQC